MTKKQSREAKDQRLFRQAIIAMQNGMSVRGASSIARLPRSTFHYRVQNQHKIRAPRTYLTEGEEATIVDLLERYASSGFPVRRTDLAEVIQMYVRLQPAARQKALPFPDGKPGRKFLKLFATRHSERIHFIRASKQEEIRWAATNGTNLTQHFAQLEALIIEHNIDPSWIANLDETGTTPNRDCNQTVRTKVYNLRGIEPQLRSPEFQNVNRVTMMPVIFADGSTGRSIFVCKGKQLRHRTVSANGNQVVETLADCLPRGSIVTMREKIAGVDTRNFISWAEHFVKDVKDLTENNRKLLPILDGYRSHMSYQALSTLEGGNVIVYSLPAHTSGYTQPLDISVFGPFKERFAGTLPKHEVLFDVKESWQQQVLSFLFPKRMETDPVVENPELSYLFFQ